MLVCVVIDPNGCSSHALFLKLTVLKSTRIECVNYFLFSFVYGQGLILYPRQAGLKLSVILLYQPSSAGIIDVSHCNWLFFLFLFLFLSNLEETLSGLMVVKIGE